MSEHTEASTVRIVTFMIHDYYNTIVMQCTITNKTSGYNRISLMHMGTSFSATVFRDSHNSTHSAAHHQTEAEGPAYCRADKKKVVEQKL